MKTAWRALAAAFFGLLGAQWLHAAPYAYVTHQNGVSVVDLASRSVIAELPAGAAIGVAVRADVNRVYVAGTDKVSVVDMRPQALVATAGYPTSAGALVTMRPGRPEAYVLTNSCVVAPYQPCATGPSVIRLYNTDTNAFGDTFTDTATSRVAFTPDGQLLLLAHGLGSSAAVSIQNADTRQNLADVALAGTPGGMAVDVVHNMLFVVESSANSVAAISLATRALVGHITVGSAPSELAIAGTRLFVTNTGGNSVSVIDTNTRTVIGTIGVGSAPVGIDVTPAQDEIVVANSGSNSVTLIDAGSANVIATVPVGPAPQAIGRFIGGPAGPTLPDQLTGLWWNPAQPGMGVHVTQRGTKIFAAWFTYSATGSAKWYVSSDCILNNPPPGATFTGPITCSGNVYDATGPHYFSDPYNPSSVQVNKLGIFQMGFSDRDTGSMSVVIGNAAKTFNLKRQVFRTDGPAPATDFTDLWWNPSESGWGIGITQQFGTMFLAWFAYDDNGASAWLVASNCVVNAAGTGCSGDLYRVSGPIDPLRNSYDASKVSVAKVGTISASFSDANNGRIDYVVDGKGNFKTITRQLF